MAVQSPTPNDGVAWITGASSGIGYALALQLAAEGWTVAATARSADKLDQLVADSHTQTKAQNKAQSKGKTAGKVHAYAGDVSNADAMADIVAQIEQDLGPIALGVLNAGIYLPVKGEAPDFDRFKRSFDVNVLGTAACLTALNPRLCSRRKGQIAIVSSATGFGGMPTASAYGASKAALINMAECLKIELDRWGVKVQIVTPGFVETPAQDDNHFPKPAMVTAQTAARRIVKGLKSAAFEITFPKRFTMALQMIYALPKDWYLALVTRQTKWSTPVPDGAKPGDDIPPG